MDYFITVIFSISITIFCLWLLVNRRKNIKELSTYVYDYEKAKRKYDLMRETFLAENPEYYIKLVKIDCHYGWNFYYKIERK